MVYLSGLDSIIESIYLSDGLSTRLGSSTIFVNPDSIKYIANKLIIITQNDYPYDDIETLLSNNNKIISRVYINNDKIEVRPYIVRINDKIMWNGRVLEDFSKFNDIYLQSLCEYDESTGALYFPKINLSKSDPRILDENGNLTCIGYALHQVGINLIDSPFTNLDILKAGKTVY